MRVMQHAALHAQGQHIIWQQIFIKRKNTPRPPLSQRKVLTNFRCIEFKKVIDEIYLIGVFVQPVPAWRLGLVCWEPLLPLE